jgi:hypothetical protein
MDLGELANRDKVFRRGVEDTKKLGARFLQPIELEERPAQCDACRQVGGMLRKARLAHTNGFCEVPCPPVLLGKLRKSNRRRILLDPASKIFNPGVVGHSNSLDRSRTRNMNSR